MPKHPFPSTAKTTRTVCKSGQRKMAMVRSACGIPSQPGAPLPLTAPRCPHGADLVLGCPGWTGMRVQNDITVGGLEVGGRARTQPSLGWASLGQARLGLGILSLQCPRDKSLWDMGVVLP